MRFSDEGPSCQPAKSKFYMQIFVAIGLLSIYLVQKLFSYSKFQKLDLIQWVLRMVFLWMHKNCAISPWKNVSMLKTWIKLAGVHFMVPSDKVQSFIPRIIRNHNYLHWRVIFFNLPMIVPISSFKWNGMRSIVE